MTDYVSPYPGGWVDSPDGVVPSPTPASAAALQQMDNGIGTAQARADAAYALGGAGGSGGTLKLSGATVAGATTAALTADPASLLAVGSFVAVGALTTKCEVRRVTAVASQTLTLSSALAYAHPEGALVFVLNNTLAPLEWWGCRADTSSYDSGPGFQQALHDIAFGGANFGLTGHGRRFYTALPNCINDGTHLDRMTWTIKTPYAINPMIGKRRGVPDTFRTMLAGQVGTITSVDTATNRITLSTSQGTAVGDRIVFYAREGDTLPAPLEAGRAYYILTNPSTNVYTYSIDSGGAELDITSAGSGTILWYSGGAGRMQWDRVVWEGSELQGINGVFAVCLQPSKAINFRSEAHPGPWGQLLLSGQQANLDNPMFIDGSVGLTLAGMQFLTIDGGYNMEDCDKLLVVDTIGPTDAASSNRDNLMEGGHYESPGIHTAQIQTIVGNPAVSAGTFTLSFFGQTTAAIAFNASAATILAALEALSTIDPGDVTVTQEVGLLSAGGRMRISFVGGQYGWKTMSGTQRTTIATGSLTGGTYSMNYVHPDARAVSIKGACAGLDLDGGTLSSGGIKADGTSVDLVTVETTAADTDGFSVRNFKSLGQGGYAINDLVTGHKVAWADGVADGCSERLAYYSRQGGHGGTIWKNWYLAGRSAGHMVWDEYQQEFRANGGAKFRFGDTGPLMMSGAGSPEGSIAAPIGSIYLRTDGGTNTSLYRKESGTGNTGWIAVTNAAAGGGGFPRNFALGSYYTAVQASADSTFATTLDRCYYVPFPVGEALDADRISLGIATAGTAGAVVRLGIYADGDGKPGSRIVDAGTIAADSTGYKELTISQSLSAATLYWLAVASQVALCTVRAIGVGDGSQYVGGTQAGDPRVCNWIQTVSGALPATATPGSGTSQNPAVKVRAA